MAGIATLALAYVLSQFYRSFLAVLTPALTAELGATKAQLSFASGAFFITFALAQFAIGVSLDRLGPRRTASTLLLLGGGGGAFVFASATPLDGTTAMAMIGVGCAPVLMSSLFIFARTFSIPALGCSRRGWGPSARPATSSARRRWRRRPKVRLAAGHGGPRRHHHCCCTCRPGRGT